MIGDFFIHICGQYSSLKSLVSHFPQEIQLAVQSSFISFAGKAHCLNKSLLGFISSIIFCGQLETQTPHPLHLSVTRAVPFFKIIADSGQTEVQVPYPKQPYLQKQNKKIMSSI